MDVTTEICKQIVERSQRPKLIKVSLANWVKLTTELSRLELFKCDHGFASMYIMGIPVVYEGVHLYCRNCGAESTPGKCSYCHSPSEFIELND